MISDNLLDAIRSFLSEKYSQNIEISKQSPVSGGDINRAYEINTTEGNFFIKLNHAGRFPDMFEKEAKGLKLLAETDEINVPDVVGSDVHQNDAFLILKHIGSAPMKPDFWELFGRRLARMHQHGNECFGLDHDNYIGSLPQSNTFHQSWVVFFVEERLEKQLKMARDDGKIGSGLIKSFERLYKRLPEIFPEEPPALLHGDLWSGNYMVDQEGDPCLIDPAVYYGHREMDLGMSLLFGGFDREFYSAYHDEYPLEKSWRDRTDICNLYPLMVHVNLFGGSYVQSLSRIINKF
ncbi:MAG: fructosamine kinase family protein [Bacteroidales bacterium]|nr:fructosamine kinase family protein [Bacteroidales bacterium]MCF8345274.1 fructosamine kinase family protein [Bacteroidales bacterium]MCF8349775.1 fructosamine kinase family protein [Bacteroidales bacterium]MCF8376294.1 fructosamine kinase family protein [Bacteroidales bacterium]MCF8400988.1 fructosamine kinase family protein [Bacteroidales bacterium]